MHSSFPPAGEREHGRHLMVRMYGSDTAGLCVGWGKGEDWRDCVACVCVCVCVRAYLSHHVAMHLPGVIQPEEEKVRFVLHV